MAGVAQAKSLSLFLRMILKVGLSSTTQVVPSMAPGTAKRVEYPHDGFQATVTRTVYGPDGSLVHQNTWFSDYRVVNGITLVGPTAAAPEPPDEDTGETAGEGGTGDAPPAGDG